jgi:Tfp pilus assembly protein PilO
VLILLSSFIVILLGASAAKINNDIKKMKVFLANAEGVQPNFEKSLEIYTQKTEETIQYLLKLRPGTKEEYVEFISRVENIGEKLSLDIDLQSIVDGEDKNTIGYSISFYGSFENLKNFLTELESLPYYIKIGNIEYRNPKFLDEEEKEVSNINLETQLYIK